MKDTPNIFFSLQKCIYFMKKFDISDWLGNISEKILYKKKDFGNQYRIKHIDNFFWIKFFGFWITISFL